MRYDDKIVILDMLYDATIRRLIKWTKDEQDWISSTITDGELEGDINVRYLFYEATNQIGADPYMLEFNMPGCNAVFAIGTKGYDILHQTISVGLGHEEDGFQSGVTYLKDAIALLEGTDPQK